MKITAIGDIHGCLLQLEDVLNWIRLREGSRPIFLGDYVDVGPHSREVIDCLLRFQQEQPLAIFLAGNHEIELINFLETGDFVRYAKKGGLPTIRSYCGFLEGDVHKAFVKALPSEHLNFLSNLLPFFETEDYFFSHAGFDPLDPSARSIDALAKSSYEIESLENGLDGKTVVCGHYFQSSFKPVIKSKFVGVDTGCGVLGGPLTAVCFPMRETYSAPATKNKLSST